MRLFRSRKSTPSVEHTDAPVEAAVTPGEQDIAVDPEAMFITLKGLGMTPRHIVDIGANRGDWTRKALAVFPEACMTLFEPQRSLAPAHADLTCSRRVRIHYAGVGDIDGTATFTEHTRDDSSSFIYSETDASAQGLTQSQIEICRLDTVLSDNAFGPPDIVKIDAEGYDLKVLDGARETLAQADIVLLEAAVACPTYPNTIAAVMSRMDLLGYRLFDITDLNRGAGRGVLWLIEAAFVRMGSPMDLASANVA